MKKFRKNLLMVLALPVLFFGGMVSVNAATINFNSDGGSEVAAIENIPVGTTIDLTESQYIPTKDGNDFRGWLQIPGYSSVSSITINSYDEVYNLEAWWKKHPYTISYDLAGGSVETDNPVSYSELTADITLNNPTREGFEFTGWTGTGLTDKTMTVVIQKGSTGNRNYTANWAEIYSIGYDLAGGSVETANPTNYTSASDDITLNNPIKEGFEFTGWTGTGLTDKTMTVVIPTGSKGDRSYTANWKNIIYHISYDLGGGEWANPADNITVYWIDEPPLTLRTPVREGFEFLGWTGTDVTEPTLEVVIPTGSKGDRSFTAHWKNIIYHISYDLDGGEWRYPADNITVYWIDEPPLTLRTPVREGFEFLGWTGTDVTEPTLEVVIPTGSKGDRSFTAHWQFIYKIITGANQTYTKNVDEGLTITCNGDVGYLVGIEVDGKMIDPSKYSIVSGSTILTLSKDYLNSLSLGTHSVKFVYEDGSVDTNFTIVEGPKPVSSDVTPSVNPKTGDNIILYVIMLIISMLSLTFVSKEALVNKA